MNSQGTITLIVAIVIIVIVIIVIAVLASRRRRVDANRQRATSIRQDAGDAALAAKEQEARAARAQADAKEAEVNAERLRREAAASEVEAQSHRANADEQLRKADQIDPDVRTNRRGDVVAPAADATTDATANGATDVNTDGTDRR